MAWIGRNEGSLTRRWVTRLTLEGERASRNLHCLAWMGSVGRYTDHCGRSTGASRQKTSRPRARILSTQRGIVCWQIRSVHVHARRRVYLSDPLLLPFPRYHPTLANLRSREWRVHEQTAGVRTVAGATPSNGRANHLPGHPVRETEAAMRNVSQAFSTAQLATQDITPMQAKKEAFRAFPLLHNAPAIDQWKSGRRRSKPVMSKKKKKKKKISITFPRAVAETRRFDIGILVLGVVVHQTPSPTTAVVLSSKTLISSGTSSNAVVWLCERNVPISGDAVRTRL